MDCKYGEEMLVPYMLGAIDEGERRLMDGHLDSCSECRLALQGNGEAVAGLAYALPQLEVPPRVKELLFDQIDGERSILMAASQWLASIRGAVASVRRAFTPHLGKALASTLVVALAFTAVWFNGRLDSITQENEELIGQVDEAAQRGADVMQAVKQLSGQVDEAAEREAEVMQVVKDQRDMTYDALSMSFSPGTSVNLLKGTGRWTSARGMMMVSQAGTQALLLVVDLPPLPTDRVYQVWLIKNGQRYSAGWFTVDSTGYGQTVIMPVARSGNSRPRVSQSSPLEVTTTPPG